MINNYNSDYLVCISNLFELRGAVVILLRRMRERLGTHMRIDLDSLISILGRVYALYNRWDNACYINVN